MLFRSVPYIQIPTSSTAMIDSSVGGKTAINVPAGKNLIGAFHQPKVVYADMDCLATLGQRELVEGISEAIKMGCIRLSSLFDLLEAEHGFKRGVPTMFISEAVMVILLWEPWFVAMFAFGANQCGNRNPFL